MMREGREDARSAVFQWGLGAGIRPSEKKFGGAKKGDGSGYRAKRIREDVASLDQKLNPYRIYS